MSRRIVQFAVSLALLGLLLWWLDIERLAVEALTIKPTFALLALGLLLIQNDFATRRWTTVLRAFKDPPSHLRMLRIQYMALFTQLFLPSTVGGAAVRVGVLFRAGYPLGVAFNSVVLDRIVAVGGLVLLAVVFLPAVASTLSLGGGTSALVAIAVTSGGGLAVVGAALRWRPLSFWFGLLKRTPARAVVEPLEEALPSLTRLRTIAGAFAFSLCGQFAAIVAIYILSVGKELHIDLLDCVLIMPPVMLLSALPISIAGWGVREGAMVIAFGLLGVAPESALVISVQFAIIGHIATLPGAVAWLLEVDREAYGKIARTIDARNQEH